MYINIYISLSLSRIHKRALSPSLAYLREVSLIPSRSLTSSVAVSYRSLLSLSHSLSRTPFPFVRPFCLSQPLSHALSHPLPHTLSHTLAYSLAYRKRWIVFVSCAICVCVCLCGTVPLRHTQ